MVALSVGVKQLHFDTVHYHLLVHGALPPVFEHIRIFFLGTELVLIS
jgi:hypothetical protein